MCSPADDERRRMDHHYPSALLDSSSSHRRCDAAMMYRPSTRRDEWNDSADQSVPCSLAWMAWMRLFIIGLDARWSKRMCIIMRACRIMCECVALYCTVIMGLWVDHQQSFQSSAIVCSPNTIIRPNQPMVPPLQPPHLALSLYMHIPNASWVLAFISYMCDMVKIALYNFNCTSPLYGDGKPSSAHRHILPSYKFFAHDLGDDGCHLFSLLSCPSYTHRHLPIHPCEHPNHAWTE